jgi:hypothetical protein
MAKKKKKSDKHWMENAEAKMEESGTKGAFGKATKKKIAKGKKRGGLAKQRAVFAENAKNASKKSKRGRKKS